MVRDRGGAIGAHGTEKPAGSGPSGGLPGAGGGRRGELEFWFWGLERLCLHAPHQFQNAHRLHRFSHAAGMARASQPSAVPGIPAGLRRPLATPASHSPALRCEKRATGRQGWRLGGRGGRAGGFCMRGPCDCQRAQPRAAVAGDSGHVLRQTAPCLQLQIADRAAADRKPARARDRRWQFRLRHRCGMLPSCRAHRALHTPRVFCRAPPDPGPAGRSAFGAPAQTRSAAVAAPLLEPAGHRPNHRPPVAARAAPARPPAVGSPSGDQRLAL